MSAGTQVPQNSPSIVPEDLTRLGVESQLIPFIISTTLRVEQSPNGSPPLSPVEVENLVETLDKVVSSTTANPGLKSKCLEVLRKASSAHDVLPKSYFLPGVVLSDTTPHTSGGFAHAWKGRQDENQVLVKAFLVEGAENPEEIKRAFYREIVRWKHVSHPNALPFLGVSETLFPFSIIIPWLPNGNITDYIWKHPGANRLGLLAQTACGLEYLHSQSIVHSNVIPESILITEEGNARLGDFGIRAITTVVSRGISTTSKPGVIRYLAPELLITQHSDTSKESDIYSFAMTAYEILSGVLPYGIKREADISFEIVSGRRPPRPDNPTVDRWLPDSVWDIITHCWDQIPQSRLPADLLHRALIEPGLEQKRSIPVTENVSDTATTCVSDTVVESPGPSTLEEKRLAQGVRSSTKPPGEHPNPLMQSSPVKRNLLKKVLAGIRRMVKRVFHRRRR